jgi:hypothetical protein
MANARLVLVTATRQAVLITCAAWAMATVAAAQTTFTLKVGAAGTESYRGTSQVTSAPPGIDCRAELVGDVGPTGTCTAGFPAGAAVTLTATPLYDGMFAGWTGACAGQGATCHVEMTMDTETTIKTIARTYTLTVRGTGDAFGQVHSMNSFAHPSIACNIQGNRTWGTCVSEVPSGQMVWLGREEPTNTFARFSGWSGCAVSDQYTCRMVMDGPKTVGAGWIAPEIVIRSNGGTGTGKVTGPAPPGTIGSFDCTITPTGVSGDCSALWETGPVSITLTATPNGNSVFLGWLGWPCSGKGTCVMSPATQLDRMRMEIRVLFEIPEYQFSVSPAGTGSGNVTFGAPWPDCVVTGGVADRNCSIIFPRGTSLTLTADPTGGSTFGGWVGACSGTEPTCALVVNADTRVGARFDPPRPAGELALALLGHLTISADEQHQLDRFGNADGTFNLGDLLALVARTHERLSPSTLSALTRSQASGAIRRGDGRPQ